ncbi:acyl-CoA carboxylase subunit beta [Aquimarina sp. D1M17]|uniref:acyl-CoA carboxylase subunit beta n=1 Tax=Aquimarina acroporae TaxID=2937283 RepID=UPI0020BE9034|nr:carboxyl transferase domain-containing protein [Aquimarina acroporae]MCK8523730.1 acyl-CoA carboxylase subunit beta [Aquimarina acroporae]
MRALVSNINTASTSFKENKQAMQQLVEKLNLHLEESRFQGKEKSIDKARSRNKLLARERIELLLDKDSPFLELLPLAGMENKNGFGAGGTNVSGIGLVEGKLCMINSNVGTRKGGSVDYATVFKGFRISKISRECRLPSINLVESGGANLPDQAKIFNYGGEAFREITRRSEMGIPTISVVFGNATAGGAYVPGMSDYAIFQKQAAKVFLAGPPLVKMATNEVATDEELGGAEMHSRVSGVSDYLAEDELDAIRIAREIMEFLPESKPHLIPEFPIKEPLFSADEIPGVVPADIKTPFDVRELIMRITDGSEFSEFKPEYGNTMVCGWAKIHGYPVGILGNNGVIFSESANKGAQFIQLSNQKNIPLLFLQNTTGYMVGKTYEEGGIIKNGAKLINAVSNSKVPSITLMIGSSFGAGNYGMNGRSYEPNFLFSYPNAKIGVMGSQQLAGVMRIIQKASAKAKGIPYDEEQAKMIEHMLIAEAEAKSSAWYSTSELWDDGIIDPKETRNYMGFSLAVLYNQEIKGTTSYGVWRH